MLLTQIPPPLRTTTDATRHGAPQAPRAGSLSSPQTSSGGSNNSQSASSSPVSSSGRSGSGSPSAASSLDLSSCGVSLGVVEEQEDDDDMMVSPPGARAPGSGRRQEENFSALQQLQFALEKNALFSNVFTSPPPAPAPAPAKQQRKGLRPAPRIPKSVRDLNICQERPLHDQQAPVQSISLEPAIPDNIFQCPLCSITCNERHSFNEHLVTHTQQIGCPRCDFITGAGTGLQEHMATVHGVEEEEDDDSVPVPKLNSQSKVKKFKCKTCEHVSVTKTEFWAHTKSHIKQDKMLQCPKCPFVTEYKHHLEYHLRNHTGSKPFQCSHCPYSCVNKSMLASHLKSHSTIYQYRCADCDYATKYCHSLKMHLRKHGHGPQMVLNPDGTPNPLPIIDVYGTRRGPKLKKPNYSLIPITQLQVKVKKAASGGKTRVRKKVEPKEGHREPERRRLPQIESNTPPQAPQQQAQQQPLLKCAPTTTTMLQSLLLQNQQGNNNPKPLEEQQQPVTCHNNNVINFTSPPFAAAPGAGVQKCGNGNANPLLELYANALNQYLLASNPHLFQQLLANNSNNNGGAGGGIGAPGLIIPNPGVHGMVGRRMSGNSDQSQSERAPAAVALDLRAPGGGAAENNRKRNRKGRAHRFDRNQLLQEPAASEEEDAHQEEQTAVLDFSSPKLKSSRSRSSPQEAALGGGYGHQEAAKCKYCDISFPDQFLYRMHMSYHYYGDSEPFLCKCGTKTRDNVAFFIHLTTEPH